MEGSFSNIVNRIWDAVSDFLKKINAFFQFIVFILFCTGLWLLNDSTEFIRNYRISNKIKHIKELESIIQTNGIDSLTKANLKQIQNGIIQRESHLERLYILFWGPQNQPESDVNNKSNGVKISTPQSKSLIVTTNKEFNIWLHIFCSSWLGVILLVFSIIWLIRERGRSIKAPFILMILSIINIFIFSVITYVILPKELDLLVSCLIKALFYSVAQLLLLIAIIPYVQQHEKK